MTLHDPRAAFHAELDAIMRDIVRLAGHVTEAIPTGTEALLSGDLEAARRVVEGDDVLDERAAAIEERCYEVLALQQPMAADLRAVITAMRLVAEIERSGDLMVNVCKGVARLHARPLPPILRGNIADMSDEATRLFRSCMDAYAEGDAALAASLDLMDDRLDAAHAAFVEAVLTWGGGGDVRSAVELAMVGRFFERIGDHAVNIGERVRYMVDGWLPEHRSALGGGDGEGDRPAGEVAGWSAPGGGRGQGGMS